MNGFPWVTFAERDRTEGSIFWWLGPSQEARSHPAEAIHLELAKLANRVNGFRGSRLPNVTGLSSPFSGGLDPRRKPGRIRQKRPT